MINCNLKPLFLAIIVILTYVVVTSKGQLRVGFYSQTCPSAESIVRNAVQEAVFGDRQMAPRLLRLLFHDCFVQVPDHPILLLKKISVHILMDFFFFPFCCRAAMGQFC